MYNLFAVDFGFGLASKLSVEVTFNHFKARKSANPLPVFSDGTFMLPTSSQCSVFFVLLFISRRFSR